MTLARLAGFALVVALPGAGCTSLGEYVWAEDLPPQPRQLRAEYVIQPGDLLGVQVYGHAANSGTVRVRMDGRISLPLMSDQIAGGLRPQDLAELLRAQLQVFIRQPVVTVTLEERNASRVSVIGQVTKPGSYRVEPGDGVLHVIARAGGLAGFADDDRIFLVRGAAEDRPAMRVRFRYRDLLDAAPLSIRFEVQDGDVLVVD